MWAEHRCNSSTAIPRSQAEEKENERVRDTETVIGSRLKQSGMFWTVRGANAIIALRCCELNRRFEDYGEARRLA